MHLADLGADVVLVERPKKNPQRASSKYNIINRGKRIISLDLKSRGDVAALKKLIQHADGLIEGMRPGVMERLDLGPDICRENNPRLVYGRITGWGQEGPLSHAAGHDNNYAALSGALWYASPAGKPPVAPPTLIGDIGGGALYLTIGMLAAIMSAQKTGLGDVVDAAMVDGTAHMMNLLLSAQAAGIMREQRGASLLDGPHWFETYQTKDSKHITLGALEPQFYALLLEKLELSNDPDFTNQFDLQNWPAQKQKLTNIIQSKTQDEWRMELEGSDVCFAPVLSPKQSSNHPHMVFREIYYQDNGVLEAKPAPRFKNHPLRACEKQDSSNEVLVKDVINLWSQEALYDTGL